MQKTSEHARIPLNRADGTFQSDGRCDHRKTVATPTKRSLRVLDSRKIQQGSQRLLEAGIGGGHRNHPGRGLVPRCGEGRPLPNLFPGCPRWSL